MGEYTYYFQQNAAFFIAIYLLVILLFVCVLVMLSLLKRLERERFLNEEQKADLVKFKLAVQNVYDTIVFNDANLTFLYVNRAFEHLTGFATREVIGRKAGPDFTPLMPADVARQFKAKVINENANFMSEFRLQRRDGSQCYVRLNSVPIFDEYGKLVFIVSIASDITHEKETEQAKSDFVSIVSHQLRTPLTIIKGYVSMLKESSFGPLAKEQAEILDKIYSSNDSLISLVQDFLNLSRIEAGQIKYNFEQVDLGKLASDLVDQFAGPAKAKGLKLDLRLPQGALAKVQADKEKISQVIINYLDNAIKYTPLGSISVKVERVGEMVRFQVADTGLGLKTEEIPNLFVRYSRGSSEGENSKIKAIKGIGLGLYVGKMIVNAHNGRVWAESAGVGQGSSFSFELPAAG